MVEVVDHANDLWGGTVEINIRLPPAPQKATPGPTYEPRVDYCSLEIRRGEVEVNGQPVFLIQSLVSREQEGQLTNGPLPQLNAECRGVAGLEYTRAADANRDDDQRGDSS